MIYKGKSFEEIHQKNLTISKNDFREFKAWCDSEPGKAMSKWGKDQRALNFGTHNLGSGDYRGKKPNWAKEGAEREAKGLPDPYGKFPEEQTRKLIRSLYHEHSITNELTTNPKVKELEHLLVRIQQLN